MSEYINNNDNNNTKNVNYIRMLGIVAKNIHNFWHIHQK